ncbi:MAG: hypothetical protein GQ570_03700 [Helicobacteraceae bacterium]|nr:hypothetical protein [Helicobacteraceae bacterium]
MARHAVVHHWSGGDHTTRELASIRGITYKYMEILIRRHGLEQAMVYQLTARAGVPQTRMDPAKEDKVMNTASREDSIELQRNKTVLLRLKQNWTVQEILVKYGRRHANGI